MALNRLKCVVGFSLQMDPGGPTSGVDWPLCGPTNICFLPFFSLHSNRNCTCRTKLLAQNSLLLCLFPSKGDTLLTILTIQNYDKITVNNVVPQSKDFPYPSSQNNQIRLNHKVCVWLRNWVLYHLSTPYFLFGSPLYKLSMRNVVIQPKFVEWSHDALSHLYTIMIHKTKQPQIEQLYQTRSHLCDVILNHNKLYDTS